MTPHRLRRARIAALACAVLAASTAGAQTPRARPRAAGDSLRVLRFQPDSAASPVAPVVITFDRPVAPALDESMLPDSLVSIVPAKAHRTYWRDASTLVTEFDELWTPGASYEVRLAAGVRAPDGRALARRAPWRVRVQQPRLIEVSPIGPVHEETREANASAHVNLVFSGVVTASQLAGRLWFVPRDCASRDSVRLNVLSVRRVSVNDSYQVKEAGGYDRDRRLDSLRRVVEVRAERPAPRGCVGAVRTPAFGATPRDWSLQIVPAFTFLEFRTHTSQEDERDCTGGRCEAGLLVPRFSQPVTREELLAHVRIDGRPPRFVDSRMIDTLHAGRRVRVSVDGRLRSRYGERLGASLDTMLAGWQLTPALGFAKGQIVLPSRGSSVLRVRYANTDSVRVVIARVADTSRSRALRYTGTRHERVLWSRVVADSVVRVVAARADSVHEGVLDVPASWIPARWGRGALLAVRALPIKTELAIPGTGARTVVPPENERPEPRFAVPQRSDLVAHAARHGDAVEVWVTRRATGEPVQGARITAFARGIDQRATATTDAMGLAHLDGIGARSARDVVSDRHVEIVADADRLLLAIPPDPMRDDRDVPDDTTQDPSLVVEARRGLHGAAFSDRGIYRPGERVYVKGIARSYRVDSGYAIPAADSVRWTLTFERDGARQVVTTRTGRLGDFGTQADSLELPATARVGWYRATFAVRGRDGWQSAAETSVSVAEYRVPEFEVRATADTSPHVYAGDSATIRVEANYLFGPPMAGAVVNATVHTSDSWGPTPQVSALKGFQVGRSTWMDEARAPEPEPQPAPARLGADGRVVLRVPSRRITRPGLLSVSVNVQDASRQTVAAHASVPLRTADAFVGIRTTSSRWDWPVGQPIPLELIAVRGDGGVRPGTTIRLAAHRMTWTGGGYKRDTTWRDSVTSAERPVPLSFVPATSGWYEIVASIRDERGRVAESGMHLGVMGPGWPGGRGTLTVEIDEHRAAPGDTVQARIEAPADLSAWVSLQKDGTLWQRLVTFKRGLNVLDVPLPPHSAGQAVLHVVATRIVEPVPSSALWDVPYFFHVQEAFSIADSVHALRVRVATERARYQPRDTVRVAVNVADQHGVGRRSEVAVWAVDEGVVTLSAFRPPPLLQQLLRGRWEYWMFGSTLLGTLMPGPPGLGALYDDYAFGGRAMLEAVALADGRASNVQYRIAIRGMTAASAGAEQVPFMRRRFSTTPFFAGTVATDADGRAMTSFVLPDNVTTYRVFAVAVDEGVRSGSGDTTIVSTRPLVVRAALPRIVRTGDSLYAGAVITREGAGTGATPVELSVQGEGLRIDGAAVARDTLAGERARERRFPMRVHAGDSVTVRFSAVTPDAGDAVQARLPVSAPGRPRAHVAMGSVRREETVTLDLPDDLDLARSRLVLQSGQSPVPLLRELDDRLRVYPYECTEQVASAARALIARVRLERTLGVTTTLAPADRKRLEIAVNVLLDRQRHDGGFGYWSVQHWTTPWLTSHTLDALLGAKALGVAVPQGAFDRAARYLGADSLVGDYLRRQWLPAADSARWPHEALHAARLLRKLGRPDVSLEQQVWARRAELDYADRLGLALLRAAAGDSTNARALVDVAWRSVAVDGRRVTVEDSVVRRWWLFRAVTLTNTSLLRATAALRPEHPRLAPLLESVLQSARSDAGARWNTVDQAMVAEAIEAVVAPLGMSTTSRLAVADPRGETVSRELRPTGADSLPLVLERFVVADGARRTVRVRLSSSVDTPTYYALTLFEVPVVRPVRPDQEGIAVERWYERYEDGTPVTEVNEGDLVRVRLRVTAPRDREFVVVDDPLPAGLEAVDQSLRTAGALPPYAGAPRLAGDSREGPIGQRWLYGSWDGGWWTPWEHKEIRDDRVLWFARQLWRGSYQASYVARATTAGRFVRPPAQAEEMYNPAVRGRSEGGVFSVRSTETRAPNR